MTYLDWNNQIAQHFFNPEKAGTLVWLSVEQKLINEIAQKNSVSPGSFIEAVKKGPDWINRSRGTVCSKASAVYKHWLKNKKEFEYPPYIAYLALFVLAVNHGDSDDFSENNYYGRLGEIVNESLRTPHFKKTADLWDDLQNWSLEDKKSNFGEFHNDIAGRNFYVGMPSYQAVLKTKDRESLSEMFWKMGWDSDSSPTEAEILKALKNNKNLAPRTVKRIEKGKPEFLSVLADRVFEELRDYDENEQLAEDANEQSAKRGSIEICLDIDETAQTADFYFRCKRKAGFPEEMFRIKNNSSAWEVVTPSSSILSQKIEQFKINNWRKDFSAESGNYKFHYRGEKYKIFTLADDLGASDWISGQRPLPGKRFYLAAHNSLSDKIQEWGESECDIFSSLGFNSLPKEWRLFEIEGVRGDGKIKKDMPALAVNERLRIRFEGGIRLKRGNQFFNFAPPKISVSGGSGSVPAPVYQIGDQEDQSGKLAKIPEEAHVFSLPDNIPCEENIKIKIKKPEKSDIEAQKNLRLVRNRLKKFHDYSNQQGMDPLGMFKQFSQENPDESNVSETERVAGAYCYSFKGKNSYPKLPQFSFKEHQKIYLTGNDPGQITAWPANPWPESWPPTWAIQFKTYKKAAAYLIGNIEKETDNGKQSFSKEQMELWKKIVWTNRKQIKSKSKKQWELWTKKRAKNV